MGSGRTCAIARAWISAPGERVDRYVLLQVLGEGGQGAVWKAEDPLDREHPRALKLVPLNKSRPSDVERIRREARALARLSHPSLVSCHGLFEDLRLGLLGLSMDFVDGASLRSLRDDPSFTPRHRVALLGHIARALAYLHSEAVVHRDLKPENVLVTSAFADAPDDPANVKLVDFGIASEEGNPNPLTALDSVVGTLSYLAPEMVDPGFFGRQMSSPAADVFAFGVLAWQLLSDTRHPTGLPARATIIEYGLEYRRVAQLGLPFPSGGPEGEWGALLQGCLAVRAADRIQNGAELSLRCESAARSNVVVRPRAATNAAPSEHPTAVESPAASIGDTEAAPSLAKPDTDGEPTAIAKPGAIARTTAAAVAHTATTEPRASSRSGGTSAVVVVLGVIAAAGIAGSAWLLFGPGGGPPTAPAPATAASSDVPVAESAVPVPSESASAAPEAGPAGALPADCAAGAPLCDCCPSGRDCGGDCGEMLPPDARFDLRLASITGSDGTSLYATYPDLLVQIGAPDVSPALSPANDGGPPLLQDVSVHDLEHGGLAIMLEANGKTLATRTAAVFSAGIPRSALCKGLAVQGFAGAVGIGEVRVFLDAADAAPTRCSADGGAPPAVPAPR